MSYYQNESGIWVPTAIALDAEELETTEGVWDGIYSRTPSPLTDMNLLFPIFLLALVILSTSLICLGSVAIAMIGDAFTQILWW